MPIVSVRNIIIFAAILQSSFSLVEFLRSKLYDEFDFIVPEVSVNTIPGTRIYVSVPDASAAIAKKIMVHDYIDDDMSLYDIAKLKNGNEKGYFRIPNDIQQVKILNMNSGMVSAPVAVWFMNDGDGVARTGIFDAANLTIGPISAFSLFVVTVMSAEPFTIQTKTQGPMPYTAVLAGYDERPTADYIDDLCTVVIDQENDNARSDMQAQVMSPLITLMYSYWLYPDTTNTITASVGKGSQLDFSGISFVTSPGYSGCKGKNSFRSSLYEATTNFKYSRTGTIDVAISSILNTDADHPVILQDNTNNKEYKWSGTTPQNTNSQNLTLKTNNLEISWTRNEKDLDQAFFMRVIPQI